MRETHTHTYPSIFTLYRKRKREQFHGFYKFLTKCKSFPDKSFEQWLSFNTCTDPHKFSLYLNENQ